MPTLRIIHCFRSPVGGIFRHVRDLIDAQVEAGHSVGILCDSITGGVFEEGLLAEAARRCTLGIHRLPMRRAIVPSDLRDIWRTRRLFANLDPDILHGHGAKGGAYARIAGMLLRTGSRSGPACLYTPHGGSMHYSARSVRGRIFFNLERALERLTDRLLFVSQYEASAYCDKVGRPNVPYSIVHNGLRPSEFKPVEFARDAADFLYVGMLRPLKGPDLAVEAVGRLRAQGRAVRLVVVGAGEQRAELERLAARVAPGCVSFRDPMPIREAFRLGRRFVLPSRAESLPYVSLEALAAEIPLIATDVGGLREIVPPSIAPLVRPNDADALAAALVAALDAPPHPPVALLRHVRNRFSVARMAEGVDEAYADALDRNRGRRTDNRGETAEAPARDAALALPSGTMTKAAREQRHAERSR